MGKHQPGRQSTHHLDYFLENLERNAAFGSFSSPFLSLTATDGSLELYDGGLRARNAQGETIFDHLPCELYSRNLREKVKSWSYMKFPFIVALGAEESWYRVGALARINKAERPSLKPNGGPSPAWAAPSRPPSPTTGRG